MTSRSLLQIALVIVVVVIGVNVRVIAGGNTWADLRYHAEVAPPRLAAAEAIQHGALPAWWDGSGLGVPLAGEPSHGAMYPPTWLASSPRALDWLAIAHLAWAAIGVALWARRKQAAGDPAALAAGLLVATTGVLASAAVRGALPALAHLPWVGWAATALGDADGDAATRTRARTRATIALAAALGAAGLAGELAVLVDAIVLAVVLGSRARGYLAAAIAAGLAIAAAQWLPAALALVDGGHAGAQVHALPLARLVELVVPGSFGAGDPTRAIAAIAGEAAWAPSVHVGVALLALGAVRVPGRRSLVALGVFAVLALVAGRGNWPHWLGAPELHVAAIAIVLGVNAAAGIDALTAGARRAVLAVGAGAGCTVVALIALAVLRGRQLEAAPAIDRALIEGGLGVVCVALALALVWRAVSWAGPLVLALLVLPSIGAMPSTAPVMDRAAVDEPPAWALAASHAPRPARFYRPAYMIDVPSREVDRPGVMVPRSPNAEPHARDAIAWDASDTPGSDTPGNDLATLAGASAAKWGLAAARSEDPARLAVDDRAWHASASEGGALLDRFGIALAILPATVVDAQKIPVLGRRGRWVLGELPVAPPAAVMRGWVWAIDPDDAFALLFPPGGGTGVLRGTTVLRGRGDPQVDRGPPLACAIERWDAGAIDLGCTSDVAGYAVVSSTPEPGWSANVDGEDAAWLSADVLRRAVALPAGSHRVEWRYRAPGLTAGLAIAGLAIALLIALAIARR